MEDSVKCCFGEKDLQSLSRSYLPTPFPLYTFTVSTNDKLQVPEIPLIVIVVPPHNLIVLYIVYMS